MGVNDVLIIATIPKGGIPDYSNEVTRKIKAQLGPYKYEDVPELPEGLINRGPLIIDNQAVYIG